MNIKYNKQKQELRDDPVIDGLLKSKEFYQKNSSAVIGTIVAVVLIAGIVMGVTLYRSSRTKHAREYFGKAMIAYGDQRFSEAIDLFRSVTENYGGSPNATTSAYMLGSILYGQGRYDEAITWYEAASKKRNAGFIPAQALEGLAACYEIKGDTATTLRYLERALTDTRIAHRRNALRWKMALLLRDTDHVRAKSICDQIIADTLARDYRQDAEYLKAMLANRSAG